MNDGLVGPLGDPLDEAELREPSPEEREQQRRRRALALIERMPRWWIAAGALDSGQTLELSSQAITAGEGRSDQGATARLKIDYVSPQVDVRPQVWSDWVYATTLQRADPAVALEFSAPVGRCSRDRRPVMAMARYADDCLEADRLGCFLQLHAQVMDDRYPSRVYSGHGERMRDTKVQKLLGVKGLDRDRYLRGLLYVYSVSGQQREEVGPDRYGRAVSELGAGHEWMEALRQVAEDEAIDEWNRLRAAYAYRSARSHLASIGAPGERAAVPTPLASSLRVTPLIRRLLGGTP